MSLHQRLITSGLASTKHFLFSLAVAVAIAALIFGFWYPNPYDELVGGQELFRIIILVDVICGPLLTLVIYNPKKPRIELFRDLGFVIFIQLAALGYGLYSLMQARPVWLAFEKDIFRVVSIPDLMPGTLEQAPQLLQKLSLTGPKPLGVRLAQGTDPDFLENVQQSMAGNHPAFRPDRWIPYENQIEKVIAASRPLTQLQTRHIDKSSLIEKKIRQLDKEADNLAYLPLATENPTTWVVLIDRITVQPLGYLPLDGW